MAQDAPQDDKEDDNDLAVFKKLQGWFRESRDNTDDWREQAREDYDFVAGHQWTDDEKQVLQEQLRPIVSFNRIDPMIAAILGTELQNRQQIKYSPREQGDVKVNEIVSSTADWARDQCDAEFAESDSFGDLIICGMGYVEGNMDYIEDPEGMFVENRIDPIEMFWDTSARKKNLSDGRFLFRAKTIPKMEAEEQFPEADASILHAAWANILTDGSKGEKKNPKDSYKDNEDETSRQDVTIVEAQWWEKENFYQILDPSDGQLKEFSVDEFKSLKKRYKDLGISNFKNIKRQRKVFKQAFLGSEIIEINDLDCGQFKWKAMTGKRDRNKNVYYGIVRGTKDPQRWANKWLSQTLHIINSNAKGGVMVEATAVPSVKKFEEDWPRPDKVSWMNEGSLAKGQIQQKQPITFPSGLDKLMEFAIASIRDTSGINLEMLGLADRDQPGVLEAQRKKAGITILAHMFDSLRLMRREMGRHLLYYIQEHMSDGRLVRIVGEGMKQYVPLTKDKTAGKYDIEVDESPTSPNQKDQVFSVLMQVLPGIMKAGVPVPPDILDYLPLPSSLIEKWKQYIQQASQNQPHQDPSAMAKVQMEQQAHAQRMQMEDAHKQAEIQANTAQKQAEIQVEAAKAQHAEATKLAIAKMDNETKIAVAQISAKTQLQTSALAKTTDEAGGVAVGADGTVTKQPGITDLMTTVVRELNQAFGGLAQAHLQGHQQLAEALMAPTELIHDPASGRVVGAKKSLNGRGVQ